MHLLIPLACSSVPACTQALEGLQLPHLDKLLRRLVAAGTDSDEASSLSPPHERALARVHALSAADGCIAWAAHALAVSGRDPGTEGWGWVTPVHWDVGTDHITMAVPGTLELAQEESRALLAAMQPFFAEDGIALEFLNARRWLARGDILGNFASASLDRVAGREISAWMPSEPSLRRLQNEMQMLLYTHPVNDARSARGQPAINSFWISGTGRLPGSATAQHVVGLVVADGLRDAALCNDWEAWAQGWVRMDQHECQRLLQAMDAGVAATLTLCGERNALSLRTANDGMLSRLRRQFTHTTLRHLQHQL